MKSFSLKKIIPITISVSFALFLYVAVLTEIKNMSRDRLNKIEKLKEEQNRIEARMVEIQGLTAENRIVRIAKDSLGLIRPDENLETINVSREQINQIEYLVKEKYD